MNRLLCKLGWHDWGISRSGSRHCLHCPKRQRLYRSRRAYELIHFGSVVDVHDHKKGAISQAESLSGESWGACKYYYKIRKIRIIEDWGNPEDTA